MSTFVNIVHVITCILLVLVIMLQSGKGAEISASLGGSSQTVFGSSGGAGFITRLTSILATIFFVTSLGLTMLGGQARKSLFDGAAPATAPATSTAPAPVSGAAAPAAQAQPAQAAAPAQPAAAPAAKN